LLRNLKKLKPDRSAKDTAKKVALSGDKWVKLLEKARAHQGLLSQCRDDDDTQDNKNAMQYYWFKAKLTEH
jgi:hypothetical protein